MPACINAGSGRLPRRQRVPCPPTDRSAASRMDSAALSATGSTAGQRTHVYCRRGRCRLHSMLACTGAKARLAGALRAALCPGTPTRRAGRTLGGRFYAHRAQPAEAGQRGGQGVRLRSARWDMVGARPPPGRPDPGSEAGLRDSRGSALAHDMRPCAHCAAQAAERRAAQGAAA